MLEQEELVELEEALQEQFGGLTNILATLNLGEGHLAQFLAFLGRSDLLGADDGYKPLKSGKIIVVGQSSVKERVLCGAAKELGLPADRFEFRLGYEAGKTYSFANTCYNIHYSLIMVGPMPHSGADMDEYSSVIAALEKGEGYPPVIRMGTNGLKITKTDFINKLQDALKRNIIAA